MDRKIFAGKFGPLIDGIIAERTKVDPRSFLSSLVMGASFEGWLSFESRFALERQRSDFDLADPCCWIGNEYNKVDFGIVRYADPRHELGEEWGLAVEFKVIYNNKNWEAQVASVLADLFPAPHGRIDKANVVPPERQLAVVAVIRANNQRNKFQRNDDRLPDWEDRVRSKLGIPSDVTELWASPTPFVVEHPYLDENTKASLRFHVLSPGGA